jgi:hypothetical protein
MLKHVGDKWQVLDSTGKKVLGTHDTKSDAIKQLSAIEISKKERNESKIKGFGTFIQESVKLTLQYHDVLNPKLWDDNVLKDDVRQKLIEIGNTWVDWAGIPPNAAKDFILVGGNANYNYTPYSDVDLHILIDPAEIENCPEFFDDYMKDKKQLWSLTHDITIHDHDVEIYAQNMNDDFAQNQGVYSLTQNEWLSEPRKLEVNLDNPQIKQKVEEYINKIDGLISSNAEEESFNKLKKKFRDMRASGIKQAGEFSIENLVFKELRNLGYLDKMSSYIKSRQDERLSIK